MSSFKLNFIHLCDEVIFSQEGKLSLIGIFEVINVANIPGSLLKAWLVCNLSILDKTLDKIELDITIRNKTTGKEVIKLPTLIPPLTKQKEIGDIGQKVGITLQLINITFQETGKYILEVQANKEVVGELIFDVKLTEKKGVGI